MKKVYRNLNLQLRKTVPVISCIIFLALGCMKNETHQEKIAKLEINGSVHSISLERYEPNFIEQEGRDLFVANCSICHTLRYISMQPDFPRKTWKAEVNKMIDKFGAPILPENAEKIVNYLTKIKGKDGQSK